MRGFTLLLASAAAATAPVACSPRNATELAMLTVTNPCSAFGIPNITMKPQLQTDFSPAGNQLGADCMAWQSFIALNWQADPQNPGNPDPNAGPDTFGLPNNPKPTVWLTFADADVVFRSMARAKTVTEMKSFKLARPPVLELDAISKLDSVDLSLSGIKQAGDRKWLTAQSGQLTYYDERINEAEYAYITTNVFNGNDLTTFAGQAACANQPGINGNGGLNLPVGSGKDFDCYGKSATYGQDTGAIEIKAAWLPLPADGSLNSRFLTATAHINDPIKGSSQQTVGLVGLHIIRRVPGAPQFVWATFEHIDNTPDQSASPPGFASPTLPPNAAPSGQYTYFNANCSPASDPHFGCAQNKLPGTPCDAGGQPVGCVPLNAPMQVSRIVPVDPTANSVTGYAWSMFPVNSVFRFYRLINVQWPSGSASVPPGARTPLCSGDIQPPSQSGHVANTTMETFQQDKNSCMDCHRAAPIGIASQISKPNKFDRVSRDVVRPLGLTTGVCASGSSTSSFASSYSFLFVAKTRH